MTDNRILTTGDEGSDCTVGTWTPTFTGIANTSGSPTLTGGKYVRIGNMVVGNIELTGSGLTMSSDATHTSFKLSLPIDKTNASDILTGSCTMTKNNSSYDNALVSSGEIDEVTCQWLCSWTGQLRGSLTIVYFL